MRNSPMRLRKVVSSPYQTVGAVLNNASTDWVPGLITRDAVFKNQSLLPCWTRS
ncbi:hypothetical protein D3C76_1427440 [compost metagenome]